MSRHNTPITEPLEAYVRAVGLREPEPLRRLREATENHPRASMQIAPEQGQFLQFLTQLTGARHVLEIGAFMGYSSSWVALGLPPGGTIVTCDVSSEYGAIARETWAEVGVADRIDLRLGPAIETLDALLAEGRAESFDFAFIDADKENYFAYYDRVLALVRTGGLIAIDNVLWHGSVVDDADNSKDAVAIRAFNRKLHDDERVSITLVTMGDGLTLACKR